MEREKTIMNGEQERERDVQCNNDKEQDWFIRLWSRYKVKGSNYNYLRPLILYVNVGLHGFVNTMINPSCRFPSGRMFLRVSLQYIEIEKIPTTL